MSSAMLFSSLGVKWPLVNISFLIQRVKTKRLKTSPIVLSPGIPGEDTEEQRTYLLHFIVLKFARLLLLRHAHTQTDKCTQSIRWNCRNMFDGKFRLTSYCLGTKFTSTKTRTVLISFSLSTLRKPTSVNLG